MTWTVLTMVMLIASLFAVVEEIATNYIAEHPGVSRNDFFANYIEIEKTLRTCAVPSENMFIRPVNNGLQQSSEFDKFCYYEASNRPLALYVCQYYKFLVETYFKQHCNDPDRQPMDTTAQYQLMGTTPSAPCKKLVETVMQEFQPGVNKPVFSSTDECETLCHQSLFCTNLAYLLSIFQRKLDIQRRDKYSTRSYHEGGFTKGPFGWEDLRWSDMNAELTTVGNTRPERPNCVDMTLMCDGGSSTVEATYGPFYCNDAEQGSILAVCSPPSGSRFRAGGTAHNMVSCTCTDHGGLQSECGFWVQVDIDRSRNPCYYLACHNGGTCVESYTSYKEPRAANCSCRGGYKGKYCEHVDRTWNPCQHSPCQNGGACTDSFTLITKPRVAECMCREGFYGKYCEYGNEGEGNVDSFPQNAMGYDDRDQVWTYQRETEEPRSHFFVFLVVSIVLIIFLYIVYHNKTKIKEYFRDLQAERKARKNTRKVNYNVYIRLEERT